MQVSNQVGEPVIDLANREMIVYVAKEQHLDRITVTKMQLGGSVGIVVPDPTTVTNFSRPCSFEVTRFGVTETWKVTILHTEGGAVSGGETVAMANRIIVTGMIQEGKIPVIEYREKNPSQTRVDDGWQTLPASSVTVNGTSFTATITGLNPGTTYVYRVVIDDIAGEEVECKTAALVPLTNGGLTIGIKMVNCGIRGWQQVFLFGIREIKELLLWETAIRFRQVIRVTEPERQPS